MRGKVIAPVVVAAVLMLMGLGIGYLFVLRFQTGDIFPPYSSLRSDPLGTRVFFESLKLCKGLSVERNYNDMLRADLDSGTALLLIGSALEYYPNTDVIPARYAGRLNSFVRNGGRLVITFLPRNWDPAGAGNGTNKVDVIGAEPVGEDGKKVEQVKKPAKKHVARHKKKSKDVGEKDDDEATARGFTGDSALLVTNWLNIAFGEVPINGVCNATPGSGTDGLSLPGSISCHTSIVFTNVAPEWLAVYERNGQPVIVERKFGEGTIVVSALSYFTSNEAMKSERHPALLAWLVGGKQKVLFDEYQHGIAREPNMAVLMRKYHLEWLMAGFILLGLLFLWQRMVSLVPAHDGSMPDDKGAPMEVAEGRDSKAGLVNILRRNIPQQKLLAACVDEWRKTAVPSGSGPKALGVDAILLTRSEDANEDKLIRGYNEICAVVKKTDWKTVGSNRRKR